jgi:SAM-dependent methyltransferase
VSIFYKIFFIIKEKRLWITIKERIWFRIFYPVRNFYDKIVDLYYGIQTNNIIELSSLGLNEKIGVRVESTPYRHLYKIMRNFKINKEDVFLDLGSGLGRAMIVAGRYNFKRIIGVDVSNSVQNICKRNINRIKSRLKCKEFEWVTCNAIDSLIHSSYF